MNNINLECGGRERPEAEESGRAIESKVKRLGCLLRKRVAGGLYPPGSPLPAERDLVAMFGVSRTTVRLALKELEEAAVICKRRGSGNFVCRKLIAERRAPAAPVLKVGFIFRLQRTFNPIFEALIQGFQAHVPDRVQFRIYFHAFMKPKVYRRDEVNLLIVDGGYDDSQLAVLSRAGASIIVVNREWRGGNYICTHNPQGGYAMIEHLARRGHRHIVALMYGPEAHASYSDEMQQRLKGMKKAARELRVRLTVPAADMLQDTASYYPLVDYLFGPKSRFTAVATVHPRYAVQLYEAFMDKNIRVPEDVSVVSYDDFYYSSVLTPPLTNVRQPMQEMGRRLARVVADVLEGKPPCIRQKLLPELIDRESVSILSLNPLPP